MDGDEHEELTGAAIARLAGVSRAAVANWRRRHPEFPKPVGGGPRSPTFSRLEVERWLKETGKGEQLATAGRTDTGTQRIDNLSALLGSRGFKRRQVVAKLTREQGIADLTPSQLLAKVMVSLLPHSAAAAEDVSADDGRPHVVLDPACSVGILLMAVADRFGDRVRLAGQEIEERSAEIAAFNLRANYASVPYEILEGDSLRNNRLAMYLGGAAAVVCEPDLHDPEWPSDDLATDPRWQFGIPAPRDGELAWVQHCYAHLRPHGVAVVAVTSRTCVQTSGQHIRAALVRSGVLRDVVALPSGLGSEPDADLCLWILQRPYGPADRQAVRMIDLSHLGDAADVPNEHAVWRRLFDGADPTVCRAVARLELLDGDVNLLPSRHVATPAPPSPADINRVTGRLESLYAHVGRGLPRLVASATPPRHTHLTFGELERVGALTIRSHGATPRAGDLLVRTLGRPPIVAAGTAEDDTGVAQVVEVDATRMDAHFLATFLWVEASNMPIANTLGALSREDLRRCRLPRLPLAEQRRYGDVFRHLQELETTLTTLATASTHIIKETIRGLTAGVLAPDFTTMTNTDDINTADEETRHR